VGALVRGVRTDDRELRLAALALLGVAIGKVFVYDLASLDSLYRVGVADRARAAAALRCICVATAAGHLQWEG
jgi:hypothetical protein